jgi:hypothetical protein
VAQILAASTYPTQVVQADRWLQQHPNLQDEQLAAAVDKQSGDPSVKALTAFPSVLANLHSFRLVRRLVWASSADSAGAGPPGVLTGATEWSFSTTTLMSRAAASFPTVIRWPVNVDE